MSQLEEDEALAAMAAVADAAEAEEAHRVSPSRCLSQPLPFLARSLPLSLSRSIARARLRLFVCSWASDVRRCDAAAHLPAADTRSSEKKQQQQL